MTTTLPHLDKTPLIHPTAYVAPGAILLGDVELAEEASVWFNAVLRGDVHSIRIGRRSNIQDLTMCHCMKDRYGLFVGEDVTVGHSCTLHGCTLGDRILVGMGATILNGALIGDDCIIAAGALVTERAEIPPRSLVVGIPGKVKRELTDEEVRTIMTYSESYRAYSSLYRAKRPQPFVG